MPDEVPARMHRVCTTHGAVSSSPCPECADETYDLADPDDREFVKNYFGQRRFRRQLQAGLIATLPGLVAMFAFPELADLAFYPVFLVVFVIADIVLYRLQPAPRRELEAEVRRSRLGRGLTSTPVLTLVALIVVFPLTTEIRPPTLFGDEVLMISEAALERWALLPSELLAGRDLHTLITHAGLHADLPHLVGNGFGLLIFGLALDLRVGRLACAGVLIAGAVAGGLAQTALGSSSSIPMIGASGAVYALAGASLVTMPDRKWFLNFVGSVVAVPAWVTIPLWMALLFGVDALMHDDVAIWAHAGGFAAGALLGVPLRRIPAPSEFHEAEAEIEEVAAGL